MSDRAVAVFEIKRYMVIWRQIEEREFDGTLARIRGLVRCNGVGASDHENYRLDVYFLAEDSAVPDPLVDIDNRSGAIFMPISDISAFVDILRNEKPIYGHLARRQSPMDQRDHGQRTGRHRRRRPSLRRKLADQASEIRTSKSSKN